MQSRVCSNRTVIHLSVNVNKVALLRNSRGGSRPSVLEAAQACLKRGCHGITVHPRPDGRHIRFDDVRELRAQLDAELNVEGYPSPEWLDLVLEVRPAQATLVPDKPAQLTSDHGWDLQVDGARLLESVLPRLKSAGVRTSLFLDPAPEQVARAHALGVDRIELYTERYARAFGGSEAPRVLREYIAAAEAAVDRKLGVNAGHDLDQANLGMFATHVSGLLEVSIGHAIICDALEWGLERTVDAYLEILRSVAPK